MEVSARYSQHASRVTSSTTVDVILKKINRTYVIMFMGHETPPLPLWINGYLGERNISLLLYALMGKQQLASVEIYGEIAFRRSDFKGLF